MESEQDWVEGNIELKIGELPLKLRMTVPAKPTTVRTMLPVFQQMSNSFVELSADAAESEGKEISCKAGCGACCRQPVPLAEAEAHAIAALVEEMPEPRRTEIKKRFEDACRHFSETGWFARLENVGELPPEDRHELVLEYFSEGVACPFLEDESCSIHQVRPLACREYLVTSPAENCSDPKAGNVKGVHSLVKPSATLCAITRSDNLGPVANFVPLILSLEWASRFEEDKTERTGEEWMAEFFGNLTRGEIPGFGEAPGQS